MRKIIGLKERQRRGHIKGFAMLYNYLINMDYAIDKEDAVLLIYSLYTSYIDTLRWDFQAERISEVSEAIFGMLVYEYENNYKTPVQFWKSMQYLLDHININCLSSSQQQMVITAIDFMEESRNIFRAITNVSIDSHFTVYNACAYSLIPDANEPNKMFSKRYSRTFSNIQLCIVSNITDVEPSLFN